MSCPRGKAYLSDGTTLGGGGRGGSVGQCFRSEIEIASQILLTMYAQSQIFNGVSPVRPSTRQTGKSTQADIKPSPPQTVLHQSSQHVLSHSPVHCRRP